MSIFFDEDTTTKISNTASYAAGNITGFKENAAAAYNAFVSSELSTSELMNTQEEYGNLTQILHDNGHTTFFSPVEDDGEQYWNEGFMGEIDGRSKDEKEEEFWNNLAEASKNDINLQNKLKENGYSTKDEFYGTIGKKVQDTWKTYYETNQNASLGGKFGGFTGMAGGVFRDPLIQLTLPISFGYSLPARFGTAAIKMAKIEGMLALAAEVGIQSKVQPYRAELGFEDAGFATGAKNVLIASAGAAAIAPAFMGLFKGVGYSVDQLSKVLSRKSAAEIDALYTESSKLFPEKANKTLDNIKVDQPDDSPLIIKQGEADEHADRLNTTLKNIVNDEPLEITPMPNSAIKTELTNKEKALIEFDIDKLEFAPKIFQYKSGGDQFGLTGKLKEVKIWDQPSSGAVIVYEFKDGRRAVVDGHQRLGLAKKLKSQKPRLYGYMFREADGYTPEYAMVMGVAANLRMGTGTAVDAAKIIRSNFGAKVWESVSGSLPPRSKIVIEAQGLSRLSNDAFGMVINGKVNQTFASRVGELIDDKSLHARIIADTKSKQFTTIAEMDTYLMMVNRLPKTITKQSTLFGDEFFASTLLVERSKILSIVSKNIKQNSAAFKSINANSDILQDAGNVLAKDKNIKQEILNDKILDRLRQVAITQGELSDDLTRAAQKYRDGDKTGATKDFREAVDRAAARGDFDGITTSGQFRTNETQTEVSDIPKNQAKLLEETENLDGFGTPGSKASDDQASSLERSSYGEEIPAAIKEEAGAGSAAKTIPAASETGTQDLASASQRTLADPPSEVLAKATSEPPLVRGSTTSSVGDFNSITNTRLYHISDDFNEIYDNLSKNIDSISDEIKKISSNYNGTFKARIKDRASLQEKIDNGIKAQEISDYLGTRISVDNISQAKKIFSDISKKFRIIHGDDFLDDAGRVATNAGSEYRAIHAQIMTDKGFSFELQIRLKDMDPIIDRSHKIYKQVKFRKSQLSAEETEQLLNAQKAINVEMKSKYFEIKDREIVSEELLDEKIIVGTRIDDATGEVVEVSKTAREIFEDEAKNTTFMNRLKDCV